MTREQAINYLFSRGFTNEQVGEVVRALTYEPTTKNNLGVDCISREQALNEFCIYNSYDSIGVDKVRSYLKALPSVTPQEPVIHDNEVKDELESITNDLVPRKVVECIIKSPRTQEQMLLMLNSVSSAISQDPRWISVDERLPEKNIACLVKVGKSNLTQMAVYSDLMGTIDHRIFYQGEKEDGTFVNITQYVNAWMPLSQAYKR